MHQSGDCCQSSTASPERNRYFSGKRLTPSDLTAEQSYFRDKLRRHNRIVHGTGVVCGLEVRPAGDADAPWQIEVSPGYAMGPYGDEIVVGKPVSIDLASCRPPVPHRGRRSGRRARTVLFVTLEYAESPCAPAPALSTDAAESNAVEPGRIEESFVIRCSDQCPDSPSSSHTLYEVLQRGAVSSWARVRPIRDWCWRA